MKMEIPLAAKSTSSWLWINGLKNLNCLKLSMCHKTTLASDTSIDFQIDFSIQSIQILQWSHVKEILLKLNLSDHRSILTDLKDTLKRRLD
ncbi:hypothetical protein Tco_0929275 [Tanacetum coccineum]